MDAIKKHQKDGDITEDDLHRLQKEIQELTDSHVKEIDEHVAKKETDIMTV
jgi:ribosome recycling factor